MIEHGKAVKEETESGEVREDRVRESDCGNSIKLRTTKSVSDERGGRSGVGLTKGFFLYQLANSETTTNDATMNDSLRVESSTMLTQEFASAC